MTSHFTLQAEWNQIYLEDAACNLAMAAEPDFWDEAAMRAGMASARTMISVGTARAGDVVVSVSVRDTPPTNDDIATWDHVVDAAIMIPSGRLRVRGGGDAPEASDVIHVSPGIYQVRAYYGNLDVEDIDSDSGDDFYNVVFWPGEWRERSVIKQYER